MAISTLLLHKVPSGSTIGPVEHGPTGHPRATPTILSTGATAQHRMRALAIKMAGSLAAILMNDLAIHYDNLADQALKVRHREREIK